MMSNAADNGELMSKMRQKAGSDDETAVRKYGFDALFLDNRNKGDKPKKKKEEDRR